MIAVIGDIILDEYWYGTSDRISPEAPVPVVLKKQSQSRLGGAANVALNIKSLQEEVCLVGILGQDEAADKVKGLLKKNQILSRLLEDPNLPSIQKLRILANNHYIGRVDFEESFQTDAKELLNTLAIDKEAPPSWCVLSDYGKGTLTSSTPPQTRGASASNEVIRALNSKSCKVLVDPKAAFEFYQNAWLLKPNKKEFELYVGKFTDLKDLEKIAQKALKKYNIENFLVTLGADGMVLVNDEGLKHWPSQALDVFDVTGAGDTVIATLASFMAKGESLGSAIEKANQAAAIAVSKKGVYNVKLQELSS